VPERTGRGESNHISWRHVDTPHPFFAMDDTWMINVSNPAGDEPNSAAKSCFKQWIPAHLLQVSLLIPYLLAIYCWEWNPNLTHSILLNTPKST
jgi:hypothetical protein